MADMLLRATDVSLMKGFCCANTMLSVLPQMDAFCVWCKYHYQKKQYGTCNLVVTGT